MKALAKVAPGPGLSLVNAPIPQIVPGEVLVDVTLVGICGTDLSFLQWKPHVRDFIRLPRILGHEFVGRVVGAVGDTDLIGARVTADTDGGCGNCGECRRGWWNACLNQERIGTQRDGALAEKVAVPVRSLHRVPSDIDDRTACLLEPMGAALHAVAQFPNIVGRPALVIGPGSIGVLGGLALRASGASPVHIVGLPGDEIRLEYAESLGMSPVVVPKNSVHGELGRFEPELVLDAVGTSESINLATDRCRFGGDVVVVGLGGGTEIDLSRVVSRQLRVTGSWRRQPSIWPRAIELARNNPGLAAAVQVFDWDDHSTAFAALTTRKHIKVAIRAPGGDETNR